MNHINININISKSHHLYYHPVYQSTPLINGHYPMIEELLQSLSGVVDKALSQYSRVFAFRVDLRMPLGMDASPDHTSNTVMSKFIDSLKAKIRHNRTCVEKSGTYTHHTKVRYFWVREVGDVNRVHYHLVILLNGNAFNWLGNYQASSGNMAMRVCEAWASALGMQDEEAKSLVHFPENPAYILKRDEQESINEFFKRASYLCKAKTKHYGHGHHGYGASRN